MATYLAVYEFAISYGKSLVLTTEHQATRKVGCQLGDYRLSLNPYSAEFLRIY